MTACSARHGGGVVDESAVSTRSIVQEGCQKNKERNDGVTTMQIYVLAHRRSVFGLRKHTLDSFYLFRRQKRVMFDQPAARLNNNLFVALSVAQTLKVQNDPVVKPTVR